MLLFAHLPRDLMLPGLLSIYKHDFRAALLPFYLDFRFPTIELF